MNSQQKPARISDEARNYIDTHPRVIEAFDRLFLIRLTLEEHWKGDPDVVYGGAPRTEEELQQARDWQPVAAYLKELAGRLEARLKRRAALAYREFITQQEQQPLAA
jgi:hypothetical protein